MRPLTRRHDPAPSRWAYRRQRLMLTPTFRLFLRAGLPLGCVALAIALYFADAERRDELIGLAAEFRSQIEQRPEFLVRMMSVQGASDAVSAELRDILPLDFPISSFDLDLEAVRTKAEALDAVAEASARIRAGGVLQLDIAERIPVAVWRGRNGLELLDEGGHRVAHLAVRSERPDLPLLVGDGADQNVSEALALLEAAELVLPRVRGLLRVGERRWDLVLDRDQRVLLPEEGSVAALERVIAMDQVEQVLSRDITVIDLRNPERPTLRMGPVAAQAYRDAAVFSGGAL